MALHLRPEYGKLLSLERLPYRATASSSRYQGIRKLPVALLLDNVRSLYNVGAFFRSADGAAIEKIYLCGITGHPPENAIRKTALGAEETVPWEHSWDAAAAVEKLRLDHYEIAAIETSDRAIDLFDWRPNFPLCVLFGHEVEGLRPELASLADTHIRIPMLGLKHSLNVATAGGIVVYELLRKYRNLLDAGAGG
ncbi:MAG TPA: RNA methyltransferase [Bryobacteraceae bacterium]|jgi:23S rRNA (guanosine2251-2'-O)-methyltransferase|nr:RNA methyltransferase [Bryobacteraceae bacterium]